MDCEKLEVIRGCLIPVNLHELRSFIVMCAYYRRFIENFSLIDGPFHDLTKKNVKYEWIKKENKSFETLKENLISQLVLILPDHSKPFEVQCDACGHCLGVVLLQEEHAFTYETRRCNDHEKYLGINENKLLAIMHALDTWKQFLLEEHHLFCVQTIKL